MNIYSKYCNLSIFMLTLFSIIPSVPVLAQNTDLTVDSTPISIQREIASGYYELSNGDTIHLPTPDVYSASQSESGGPDDFGYLWDNNVPLNWVDATDGTEIDLNSENYGQGSEAIPLSFDFPFYENTYSQFYIAASGYLAFTPPTYWSTQPRIPFPLLPNDIIAPYASPLNLAETGPQNRVYYKEGGASPNRYAVVEWYQVLPSSGYEGVLTFEAILYENGDITLQYQEMDFGQSGRRWCGSGGIENNTGTDGLSTIRFCGWVDSNSAIKITRPADAARALLYPRSQGAFTTAAQTQRFPVSLQNTGALGADIYNIIVDSKWEVRLETASGASLTDHNEDGVIDSGMLAPKASFDFVIIVSSPAIANTAESNLATITATSQNDVAVQKKTIVTLAIPAPFAQIYSSGNRNVQLLSAQPTVQSATRIANASYAVDMAVAQLQGEQYVSAWNESVSSPGDLFSLDIVYEILDRQGNPVQPRAMLTADHNATYYVQNSDPTIATTPDGHIGILWYQQRQTSDRNQSQFNIFFAIVDHEGSILLPPTNLTNNTAFGDYQTQDIPQYDTPALTGTTDNHFLLAWREYLWSSADNGLHNNIDLVVYDSTGSAIKPRTRLTNSDALYQNRASWPALAPLLNGDTLITFSSNFQQFVYGRLNSVGEVTGSLITRNEINHFNLDTVQLPNGNLLMAWQKGDYTADTTDLNYLLLDGTTLGPLSAVQVVHPFPGTRHIEKVSVTFNAGGEGIITWSEREGFYLGYLLIDGQGSVLTPATQFVSGNFNETTNEPVSVGGYYNGGDDNTPIAVIPSSTTESDLQLTTATVAPGQPGGTASIYARIDNQGLQAAIDVQFSATLDPNLTLVSAAPMPDNVSAASIQAGSTYTWTLPSIEYLGGGMVVMHTTVPSTTIGSTYPITMSLATSSADAVLQNNETHTSVMEALFEYLPLIAR